jgi:cytochrome c biogenesis protein CcdA
MNDQLLCGFLLGAAGLAALAAGAPFLAVFALAGAIPFLGVGAALARGGSSRVRRVAESR